MLYGYKNLKMQYVNLIYNNDFYNYNGGSDVEIEILGGFLSSDIGCHGISMLKRWIYDEKYTTLETNTTDLEKQGDYIILRDLFPQERYKHSSCKMTAIQLFQLIHDWQEKVCKHKPQEVTIIFNNNECSMDIKI